MNNKIALLEIKVYPAIDIESNKLFVGNKLTKTFPHLRLCYMFDGKEIRKITHNKYYRLLPKDNTYACGNKIKLFHAFTDYNPENIYISNILYV